MRYKFIGVPMSCGGPYPGSEVAFKCFETSDFENLVGNEDFEVTEVAVPIMEEEENDNLRSLNTVMNCCENVYKSVKAAYENDMFPVTIGGDHSLSIGSIAAGYEAFGDDICVIWIDAHTDINNEETTESGYIHGMPIAASMGICSEKLSIKGTNTRVKGENVFVIGAHSIDRGEFDNIETNNVNLYTIDRIRECGIESIMNEISNKLKGKKLHISLDVDCLDPKEFFATGYNIEGGFSYEEVKYIISMLYSQSTPVIFECVEYCPRKDTDKKDFITMNEIMKHALGLNQ